MSDEITHRMETTSVTGPSWLLEPAPSGVDFQINYADDATAVTPDVLRSLQSLMEELQSAAAATPAAPTAAPCPKSMSGAAALKSTGAVVCS